ncbi:MAG: hemolysin III family protein [Bacteriovoracaceae bacterium]|nr:hemolysin III family protein [Bacteriovoracaceae bacterium]
MSFFNKAKEPISGITHAFGMFASIIGFITLLRQAQIVGATAHIVSVLVFGITLFFMYTASTVYHLLPLSDKWEYHLKRIDHVAIFLFIAGSYTPFCLIPLYNQLGPIILIIIWLICLAGIIFKICWLEAPIWFSTLIYVLMGNVCLLFIYPLFQSITFGSMTWLVAGGICYMVGALIYVTKRPDPIPGIFRHHEIWHIFVMAGSFCHFWSIKSLL